MMVMIVICLLMKTKSLSLQPAKKMLTFQLNFVLEDKFLSKCLLNCWVLVVL